ncbi:MAG TPA: alanine--glyoxylate aminotransferase family protein [Candidatus Sulfomarinibacteraceae bacterium]|nr:alanine--glyoxylate aminotransferase family protein [Candidatus Sulfomarinibacteraceae bacterium]
MNAPISDQYRIETEPLDMPPRLLLGPGPSNVHPRALQAMSTAPVGHLDPSFVAVMDEVQDLLRYLWQTENELTLPISGTGSAGMEAALANVVEPGDVVLVGIAGYFGQRLVEMARRYGADVRCVEKAWGEVFSLDELRQALEEQRPAVLALVQGETSSGACQPLEGVGDLCHEHDCLLLVDAVASLGGAPFFADEWGVDVAYSGSQKCLSCPPGLAPLSLSPRAVAKVEGRDTPVANWYLDLTLLAQYWGEQPDGGRKYHHTAPINMNYALRECLRLIAAEGLEAAWKRHRESAELLWDGLGELGLECHVPREHRLPSLTTVRVPQGVNPQEVTTTLLQDHNIEIANGLGQLAGKVWRVGLMGYNSRPDNVLRLLDALGRVLDR